MNDLKIKIKKTLDHAKGKNIKLVMVSVRTSPENIEKAKNLLLNYKDIVSAEMREAESIKEFGVDEKKNEIPIGDPNNPVIDMSVASVRELMEEEGVTSLMLKQTFELLKHKEEKQTEDEPVRDEPRIDFSSIKSAVDTMFKNQTFSRKLDSKKSQPKIVIHDSVFKSRKDRNTMSLDDYLKMKELDNDDEFARVEELGDKMYDVSDTYIGDKLMAYREMIEEEKQKVRRKNRVSNQESKLNQFVKEYHLMDREKEENTKELRRYVDDDQTEFTDIMEYFKNNSIEFNDMNILEWLNRKNHAIDRTIEKEFKN